LPDRKEGELTSSFIRLDFFVEVTYQSGLNKIAAMRPFKAKRLLEPYSDEVSLDEIEGLCK
jgi:hypothetical protein